METAVREPAAPLANGVLVDDLARPHEEETRSLVRQEPELDESTVLLQVIARAAGDSRIDLDRMERLMAMEERLSAKRAERAFVDAMAKFKETAPEIMKDKHVHFDTRDQGGSVDYYHAPLGGVVAAVVGGLGTVGLSHTWEIDQSSPMIKVTCVLTHTGGHSTRTSMQAAADNSGKKNAIQQVASAISYLQRYTLLAATGLATQDMDDDAGNTGAGGDDIVRLSEEQIKDLDRRLVETKSNKASFLNYMRVRSLDEIQAAAYQDCVRVIENKRQPK